MTDNRDPYDSFTRMIHDQSREKFFRYNINLLYNIGYIEPEIENGALRDGLVIMVKHPLPTVIRMIYNNNGQREFIVVPKDTQAFDLNGEAYPSRVVIARFEFDPAGNFTPMLYGGVLPSDKCVANDLLAASMSDVTRDIGNPDFLKR